ncbi:sensor histidine kinase [Deinococcus altitudinis]|uniref:sensor histidine kinase n=1 Tax=Deinococcus altitudinis TaxID=468914 RepID=UPI0038926984
MNDQPSPPRIRRLGSLNTLRFQFTLVIFLLAFMPNAILALGAGRELGLIGSSALPLALWLATVAALSALMGWVLSGALLRPLSRLTGELARGEFRATPNALPGSAGHLSDDPSEIRALRGAFAGLLGRLGTEQARRGAFMATLVHDLKTPLIATGHLIRTLSTRALPDPERQTLGEHLLTENARLLGLVQQMADAHRFEREDVRLTPADTDLRALLERVAARLQQRRPGVRLRVSGEGRASVDAAVLERAVANLADNALRYARSGLELRVEPPQADQPGSAALSVCDDGPGLPEGASIETLAQPFNAQPVEIAGQNYTAGTAGLGLYIVRRIAEAHGGDLVYSREVHSLEGHSPEVCSREDVPGSGPVTVMQIRLPGILNAVHSAPALVASPFPALHSGPALHAGTPGSEFPSPELRPLAFPSQEVHP